jgi:predicted permease
VRFYKLLLHLYPKSFRREYGKQMCADFEQGRRAGSGALAIFAFWVESFVDVIFNSAAVHSDILKQDLGFTFHTLRRAPAFAITAILVVALGVGANTAAFSVADFVLLRPMPFPESDRLVKLWGSTPAYSRNETSPANYRDWKRMSSVFDGIAAFTLRAVNMVGQGEPEQLEVTAVTSDVLPMLGVKPPVGRLFSANEDSPGAQGTLLMSYSLWQTHFGGDPSIVGRRIILDDYPFVVIGVMPRDFYFPTRQAQIWIPLRLGEQDFQDRTDTYLQVLGKLKPNISLARAQAEMTVVSSRLEAQFPKENEHLGAAVMSMRGELPRKSRLLLLALCGAAICVLLITCASLANLLLARALTRHRELAVRAALGAGRERLVRQLLTESLVVAIIGGSLGVAVAAASVPMLSRLVPNALPIAQSPSIDLHMLVFAALVTGITGVGFGVAPALRVCGETDFNGLREGAGAGGGRKERVRSALVVAEVMFTVILLISSGLLIRALWRLKSLDPGFQADKVISLRTALPHPKYDKTTKRDAFYEQVLSKVRALPGVSSAGYASFLPMARTGGIFAVTVNGEDDHTGTKGASMRFVTPGYFSTMGIPLKVGRDVVESDKAETQFAAVVSESFAQSYWPNENPIGHRFKIAGAERAIVGVVGEVRVRGFETSSEPQVYLAYKQVQDASFVQYEPKDLVVKSSVGADSLLPAIRKIVHDADPLQPIANVRMLSEIVDDQTESRVVQVRVLGAFAIISFLLAGLGIHGLLSFAVSQRTQEIGIRIALGAQPTHIMKMVMKNGVLLAAAGVIPGMVMAYVVGRTMEALLAGLKPGDAPTFLAASVLCVVMTVSGCFLPALRAVRVNPMVAIRAD